MSSLNPPKKGHFKVRCVYTPRFHTACMCVCVCAYAHLYTVYYIPLHYSKKSSKPLQTNCFDTGSQVQKNKNFDKPFKSCSCINKSKN